MLMNILIHVKSRTYRIVKHADEHEGQKANQKTQKYGEHCPGKSQIIATFTLQAALVLRNGCLDWTLGTRGIITMLVFISCKLNTTRIIPITIIVVPEKSEKVHATDCEHCTVKEKTVELNISNLHFYILKYFSNIRFIT